LEPPPGIGPGFAFYENATSPEMLLEASDKYLEDLGNF